MKQKYVHIYMYICYVYYLMMIYLNTINASYDVCISSVWRVENNS